MAQQQYVNYYVAVKYLGSTPPVIVHQADSLDDAKDLADILARTQHREYIVLESSFLYDDGTPTPPTTPTP